MLVLQPSSCLHGIMALRDPCSVAWWGWVGACICVHGSVCVSESSSFMKKPRSTVCHNAVDCFLPHSSSLHFFSCCFGLPLVSSSLSECRHVDWWNHWFLDREKKDLKDGPEFKVSLVSFAVEWMLCVSVIKHASVVLWGYSVIWKSDWTDKLQT